MAKHVVARVADFPPGTRQFVQLEGFSVGVLNIKGKFYALGNSCPHQGAPLCLGRIGGTTLDSKPYEFIYGRDDEIITCPWHGWEFEIATGRSVFNPHKIRVRTYEVTVEPSITDEEEDPSVPTYEVTVEDDVVVLHV